MQYGTYLFDLGQGYLMQQKLTIKDIPIFFLHKNRETDISSSYEL